MIYFSSAFRLNNNTAQYIGDFTMKLSVIFSVFIVFLSFPGTIFANSAPVVSNVSASQRGDDSKLVDIYYNLSDADGDLCTVWASVSNNGGSSWQVPFSTSSGHLGSNVSPGVNKLITWDAGKDIPGIVGTLKVRVFADDGQGSDSLLMVPSGSYAMGDHFDVGTEDELPLHTVEINAFMMSRYEITNQQYCEFLNNALVQNQIEVRDYVVYAIEDINSDFPYQVTTEGSSDSCISYSSGTTFTVAPGKESHPVTAVSWYKGKPTKKARKCKALEAQLENHNLSRNYG